VIAVDTNVLVYAHRSDSPWHEAATRALASLSGANWAIPWPSIHEFLAITTHPKVFNPPTPLADAIAAVDSWRASRLSLIGETEEHWTVLADLIRSGKIAGPHIHDARIAAICLQHAVEELWSADRDFGRFPSLRVRNPLVGMSPR
jgi:toxin-antitoxin system PIN domain toxin